MKAWQAPGFLTRSTISSVVACRSRSTRSCRLRKLTLKMRLGHDPSNGSTPAAHIPPTRFVAPFDIPAVNNIPNFDDINPRLGAAYDLFGTGKTAVKVSLGRYVFNTYNRVSANSPLNSVVTSTSRT